MTTTATRARRVTGLTLIALAMGAMLAYAQSDAVHRVGVLGTRSNQGLAAGATVSPPLAATAPSREGHAGQPASGWKAMFKNLNPGSCSVTPRFAPPGSWPARGEPAVAFCQSSPGWARLGQTDPSSRSK